jgi:small nuclear ribonucleoprotein (snRNP)-like protein
MLIKKIFFMSVIISLFIFVGSVLCQTDSLNSLPQMVEMKNGDIYFGSIINQGEFATLIENISGQKIQLMNKDIMMIVQEWNKKPLNLTRIDLINGEEYTGIIEDYKDTCFIIKDNSGVEMKIPQDKIVSFKRLRDIVINGTLQKFDPNRTRLFLAPTARSLNAGEGYFSDYMVITDFAIISGGVSLIPNAENQLVYGNLKFTLFQKDNIGLSAGLFYITVFDYSSGGVAYGVATIGSNDKAITFGLGNGFTGESGFSENPILIVGGEIRISNSVKIISENWIPTNGVETFLSFGFRFFGEHVAGDFGLITNSSVLSESRGFPFFPWLGFTYNFGY